MEHKVKRGHHYKMKCCTVIFLLLSLLSGLFFIVFFVVFFCLLIFFSPKGLVMVFMLCPTEAISKALSFPNNNLGPQRVRASKLQHPGLSPYPNQHIFSRTSHPLFLYSKCPNSTFLVVLFKISLFIQQSCIQEHLT